MLKSWSLTRQLRFFSLDNIPDHFESLSTIYLGVLFESALGASLCTASSLYVQSRSSTCKTHGTYVGKYSNSWTVLNGIIHLNLQSHLAGVHNTCRYKLEIASSIKSCSAFFFEIT